MCQTYKNLSTNFPFKISTPRFSFDSNSTPVTIPLLIPHILRS